MNHILALLARDFRFQNSARRVSDGTGGRLFAGGIGRPNSRAGVFGETIHSGARLPLPELCAPVGGCLVPTNEWISMHGRLRLHLGRVRLHTKHYPLLARDFRFQNYARRGSDATGGRLFAGGIVPICIGRPNSGAGVFGETIHSGARLPLPELCAPVGGCLVPTNEWISMHGRLRLHTTH